MTIEVDSGFRSRLPFAQEVSAWGAVTRRRPIDDRHAAGEGYRFLTVNELGFQQ
jgi:hypothetical protein